MPDEGRQLRGISGEQAIRAFERLGYQRRKGKGSHVNLTKANSPRLTIPVHRELRIGLLLYELKKAGITPEQFLEALR
ncbi:MAG: type II toxin-antitoxin system HicA family toxin [Chloroflexi bacterium]|nr:type II toxin-antitoxin system HicA family toxin [Chloroflexota bacterium]